MLEARERQRQTVREREREREREGKNERTETAQIERVEFPVVNEAQIYFLTYSVG